MYNGYLGNFMVDYGMYNDLFGEENFMYSIVLKMDSCEWNRLKCFIIMYFKK